MIETIIIGYLKLSCLCAIPMAWIFIDEVILGE